LNRKFARRPLNSMSRHDPKVTLLQIRDAAQRAQEICSDHSDLESLVADWKATAALERFIEILGEAVKRLPNEMREAYSNVPWKEIAGTRDHSSHALLGKVRQPVENRFPTLRPIPAVLSATTIHAVS